MSFPQNYPNSPPSVRFTSEMWHPNGQIFTIRTLDFCICAMHHADIVLFPHSVYPDGRVCISILHPPGDDPNGYELASERWTPVHTVVLLMIYHANSLLPFCFAL
jgi:ubiquitin-protein ligase